MAGEWVNIPLGPACTKIGSGATPRGGGSVYLPAGEVALIRSQNVYNDGFHFDGLVYLSDTHAAELENVAVEPADVLLNITGDSVARCCQVVPDVLPARVNQHVAIIRPRRDVLDPEYLKYYLVSPNKQSRMLSWAGSGGTRNALTKGMIEGFEITAPKDVSEQRAIASVLGALDDKIEVNRKQTRVLEGIARAVFESWFAGFDKPVRTIAAGFATEGVLEIGDGYRAKNSELADDGLPFVRAGDLRSGLALDGVERLSAASVAKAGTKLSRPGDVAFTSKGTVGRMVRVDELLPQFVYSPQVCYWRTLKPAVLHPAVLYCWMCSEDFMRQVRAVSGQTDMAPYISLRDQRAIKVPRFEDGQRAVGERVAPLLRRQAVAAGESRILAGLRGALLPKLISGELRIADAEHIVGRAV